MPAEKVEIDEAEEEGVIYKFLCNPSEIIGENGRVKAVKLQKMMLGEPDAGGRRRPVPVEGEFETIELDTVIMAIGQKINIKGFEQLELTNRGNIAADEKSFRTSLDGVFAVGDATNRGASIAIEAIGEAQKSTVSAESNSGLITVVNPRPTRPRTPFPTSSSQTRTQRLQRIHLF